MMSSTQLAPRHGFVHKNKCKPRLCRKSNYFAPRRPIRSGNLETKVRALPDIINYSEAQLVSWVLPMIIAGRVMDLNYEEIGKGLVVLGVFKTCLHVILAAN